MGKNLKELKQKIKRLKNLKQYKNLSDKELEKIALEQLEKERKKKEQSLVYTEEEQEIAEQKLKKYQEIYHIETFGEIEQLKQLVYFEVLAERIQRNLNEKREYLDPKEISSLTKTLLEIENNILNMRKSLGILEEKKEDSAFEYVQKLKKKFKRWSEENQATRHLTCIAKGSKVLMSDFTTKNIEDIKIGDEIIGVVKIEKVGLKLVKQKVKAFYYKGKKEVVKVKTSKGKEIVCTPDHLIFAFVRSKNTRATNMDYYPAENCLRRKLKTFNYINNIEDYYKGAIVGLIESDGYKYKPKDKNNPHWDFEIQYIIWQSHLKEASAVEWLLDYFKIGYTKKFEKKGWGLGAYKYTIRRKHSAFINEIYSNLFKNRDIAIGFLAGFILGDGHVDKGGLIHIVQKNKIDMLKQVFEFLKLSYTECNNNFGNGIKTFSLRRQIPLIIPNSRKSEKFMRILFSKGFHFTDDKIVSVELLSEQEVYDITTETGNFIVEGFIVHNCPHCSKQILLRIRTEVWEAQKHPYFKDRILYNEHLLRLYLAGILSAEDIGEILGITKEKDYLEWLIEKWITRPELKRLKEEAKELRKKKIEEIKRKEI